VSEDFPGVSLCDSVEAADWIRAALEPWNQGIHHVATLVPAGDFAHARILHRAWKGADDIRWADIAASSGQRLRAETQFSELVGRHADAEHQLPPEPWHEPDRGSLRPTECAAVAAVLARRTATPDQCWFCVWEGYGWPILNRLGEGAPRVALEHRNCLLFHGPVSAATAFRSEPWFQSPTLWWPEDRAWCVASELDIYSTYVAAAPTAARELVQHPELEVLECSAEHDIDHGPYAVRGPSGGDPQRGRP
jgi:hypothetical protein